VLQVDCGELSSDEQIALAGAINETLNGRGFAMVKGHLIVIDSIAEGPKDEGDVANAISRFLSRRKDAALYSCERVGDTFVIHSPDPVAVARGRRPATLPSNLFKCPFCPFVTPYEELYVVHYRSHAFVP
jgi:hypothetical protein